MKLTQEQAEKLKTLKTLEEVKAFLETERIELSPEDLEKIEGGWSIFSSVKNALKDVGNWVYDNMIDPVVDGVVDAGKKIADGVIDAATGGLSQAANDCDSLSATAPAKEN